MAIVTLNIPTNFEISKFTNTLQPTSLTTTNIVVTDSSSSEVFNFAGSGFSVTMSSGIVNSLVSTTGLTQNFSITGLSHNWGAIYQHRIAGNWNGYLDYVFNGADKFIGSAGIDVLNGFMGNDVLNGNGGNDILKGGIGNDTLNGGAGDDYLDGGVGNDVLNGGAGLFDVADYSGATAGVTVNLLTTLTSQNTIGAGIDKLVGVEGIKGSAFNDVLTGDAQDNGFWLGKGNDIVNGGAGTGDCALYDDATAGVKVNLGLITAQNTIGGGIDQLTGIEELAGSFFADVLTGNAVANFLFGDSGNDTLSGAGGNDTLVGDIGNDTLIGGAGNDVLFGDAGNDIFRFNTALNAATNKDTIQDFSAINDTIQLENSFFKSLATPGVLNASMLRAGAGFSTAADANDFIIYNKTTGALYYDADANGVGTAVQFASLTAGTVVTNADFVVI